MSTTTVDHDEIQKWVESKGGKPAAVEKTHEDGDVGLVRLMFPKSKQSEHDNLVEITWDEFFEKFEESGLALIYEEGSLFNKLVKRGNESGSAKKTAKRAPAKKAAAKHAEAKQADQKKEEPKHAEAKPASKKRAAAAKHDDASGAEAKHEAPKKAAPKPKPKPKAKATKH